MYTILPSTENPALRQTAAAIPPEEIRGERIQSLIKEMKALLAKEKFGVALAAPQVGVSLRLFVVSGRALAPSTEQDDDAPPPPPDQVYVNPELVKLSRGRTNKHEGCLSVRGQWGMVPRAEKATVRALDETGQPFTRGASGILAHIFQHEMDHLEGVLYTDKAVEIIPEDPEHAHE